MANNTEKPRTISFRADPELDDMINILKRNEKQIQTDIIIHAIKSAYKGLIIEEIFEKIEAVTRKIFKKAKLDIYLPTPNILEKSLGGVNKVKMGADKALFLFHLPEFVKDNDIDESSIGILFLELVVNNIHSSEIKFTLPILDDISKIDSSIIKKIHEISGKYNLTVKSTKGTKKKRERVGLCFTLKLKIENKKMDLVKERTEKHLKNIKEALEFVQRLLIKKNKAQKK